MKNMKNLGYHILVSEIYINNIHLFNLIKFKMN